ncbi:hypothetical protein MTO96_010667 [Rhipicephalus appendiculatus]
MALNMLANIARTATSLLAAQFDTQLLSVRFKSMRVSRRIRGYPRPLMETVQRPEPMKYGWRPILPEDGVYTTKKLPIRKLGGRDPETGRVVVRTIGGGMKRWYRWIDHKRQPNEDGSKLEERVYQRWLTATEGIKPGDIITTSGEIPRIPVQPKDGGVLCRAAGTSAQILRRLEDRVIIQLPSKLQVSLSERCMACGWPGV